MDFNSLKDTVSNLTLYDLKAGVRKVQNGERSLLRGRNVDVANATAAVMNYTDMESKVRTWNRSGTWRQNRAILTCGRSEKPLTTSRGVPRPH